jgi:hypothetical protein
MSTKSALQSKTIVGILISLAPQIAARYGYAIDVEVLSTTLNDLISIGGMLLSTYGRLSASDKIVGIIPKKERKPATYSAVRSTVVKKRGRPPKVRT